MDRTVEQWIDGWRASGYTVLYAEKTVSGFPGAVQVRLREPVVADPSNSWSWSADELVLAAEPWAPTRYRLIADGRHRANLPIAGRKVALVATAAKAEGVANFDLQGDLRDAEIVLERVEGTAPALGAAASAGRMTVMLTQAANPARTHAMSGIVGKVRIAGMALGPLGRQRSVQAAPPPDLYHLPQLGGIGRLAGDTGVEALAAGRQGLQHLFSTVDRGPFLVSGDQKTDRSLRSPLGRQIVGNRGHESGDRPFHIGRAAPVQDAVGNLACERIPSPGRAVADRHHVGVAGENEVRLFASQTGVQIVDRIGSRFFEGQTRADEAQRLQLRLQHD